MYENKYKNPKELGIKELENILQLLADLNIEIELFAMGGTAMVLKNIKESTKDIDFLTTSDYKKIKKLFDLAGLTEESDSKLCNIWHLNNTRIDIFYNEFILGIPLPDDWKEISEHIKDIGKIRLYILNWYDLIITKIARSELRDIEDILSIIKTQKIDFAKLKKRYYGLAETSLITDYDYKFKYLEGKIK
jgi:RNA recognition motif-containing protein